MYEWLKKAYSLGFATLEQCRIAVEKGKITIEQFEEITGGKY